MENQIIGPDTEFCNCEKAVVFKILPHGEIEEPSAPEVCESCGKPEPDRGTFTFNFTGDYKVIEPGEAV